MKQGVVSVIIPCRNEEHHIGKCLDSLLQSEYPKENLEIFVVDGNSTDNSRKVIADYSKNNSNIHLIENLRQVTPVAFNLGIEKSSGEFILIVGARHVLSSNYITTCVNKLNSNKELGCVGGMVENVFENNRSRIIARAMASPVGVGGGNFRTKKEEGYVDTVGTPCYRRSIFAQIGLFDEQLVRNQDDELNFRLTNAGYKILFTQGISVKYFVRASFDKLYKQYFQYGYWKVFVNRKHRTVTNLRQLVPFFFMLFLSVFIPLSLFIPVAALVLGITVGIYLLMISAVAIQQADSVITFGYSLLAFLSLHFGYGIGYYQGLIHFVLLNRKPSEAAGNLTR